MDIHKKLFRLYWDGYDGQSSWMFYHPDKTEKQFEEDVRMMMRKHGKGYLKSVNNYWATKHGWVKYVAERMVELGYEPVRPISYGVDAGGGDIFTHENKKFEDYGILRMIGEELYKEAADHNALLEKND